MAFAEAQAADPAAAARIGARLDRLPVTRSIWLRVILLSLGAFFEFYDLFFTAYIAPALVQSGVLSVTTPGLFGTSGIAGFVAALFFGLFIGTALFGFAADRLGRRTIFTLSLLWYTVATIVMAFQNDAFGLNLWRFLAGIGIGVELVTVDTYIAELVPKSFRGRAFAYNQMVQFSAVPVVAFLAWRLVPLAPFGIAGWRWVVLGGALAAIAVWWIIRMVPESPRWLASHGRLAEAEAGVAQLEARVAREWGKPLPPPERSASAQKRGHFSEIWRKPYLSRTLMLIIFNLFQTVGYYGFSNWVPTLLIHQGIAITTSLQYTFIIAIASPLAPLLGVGLADRLERKWLLVVSAGAVALFGMLFAEARGALALIVLGVLVTIANNIMSFTFHAYQAELYPTRIRALAVGFVYSWSRLSTVFTAFVIAFFLGRFGVFGVFVLIAGSMALVMLTIGVLGPPTRGRALEEISR